jgi:Integrase core domain
VTYILMRRGFLYVVAIMEWATRKVLAWRMSNTMDAGFCVAALEEVLARHGKPEIFNKDQGSLFTSQAFTSMLRDAEARDASAVIKTGTDYRPFLERADTRWKDPSLWSREGAAATMKIMFGPSIRHLHLILRTARAATSKIHGPCVCYGQEHIP